ncbi:MAG: DNA-3-methyladenine glycosylase family protein [Acidimicrobiales bacterium]
MRAAGTLRLVGPAGEPVDLRRTFASHGVATLAPQRVDMERWVLETTLDVAGTVRTIAVGSGRPGELAVRAGGPELFARERAALLADVLHILALDEDLSDFYELAERDPQLAWVAAGAGRMLRSPTVFEDVVKTVCTTNCTWSATVRMTDALVRELGAPAADGRRAFPSPAAMADAGAAFYRDVARAGYRGDYLLRLARDLADGALELDTLRDPDLDDAEVEKRLLALPGVGPYAAAHVMLTSLGRYGRLVFDSWTRPTYARLVGRAASDKVIAKRFRGYGRYAGLAFWLFLTEGWVANAVASPG